LLLAVDIGNSQTSFGVFRDDKLLYHWRSKTESSRTSDEYAAFLFPLLDHAGLKGQSWEGIAICSVVPPVEQQFEAFCLPYLGRKPFKVNSHARLGFELKVDVPNEVGADRLANAAFAVQNLKLPAVVVDLGTATTFDVISAQKTYEGGVILPGVRMGVESLSKKTSLLPMIDVAFPASVIGKNTVTCIQSGILYGYCDLLDGLLERTIKEVGTPCEVVLTGGLAPLFLGKLRTPFKYLPNLTLEGIEILYRQNII
jgi:type III pantothenate kinase